MELFVTRFLLLAVAAAALAAPVPAFSAECGELPVNAACEDGARYCDVYKRPHPRLGAEACVRVTP